MATTLSYSVPDFEPFTKIVSADMNTKLNEIKSRINWAGGSDATTGLGDDNIQSNTASGGGLTRSTKLKAGTASHVIINDGSGLMSSEAQLATTRGGTGFSPTLTGNGGKAIVVNAGGTAFELGSPEQASLTQSFSGDISSLTAGEAISANDAVCLALGQDASGNTIYRVFKCDDDLADRRVNFLGFAVAAATVTAHTLTWTDSAALVSSNVITWKINSRSYSVTFSSDNDTTLAAIATAIATDPDIQSASVVDAGSNDRVINITGKGGLQINITNATVSSGASQATITIATTQSPSGQNVRIRNFGLLSGFVGLTTGARYFLSSTAGSITTTPASATPVFVGQALSSTQLFVNINALNYQFSVPEIFVRSHGSSTNAATGGVQDTEHYNFTTWSAGTSSSLGARSGVAQGSQVSYSLQHYISDGLTTSTTLVATTQIYNKTSWSSGATKSTTTRHYGASEFAGLLWMTGGSTDTGGSGGQTSFAGKFNGSTWSSGTGLSAGISFPGCFVQGSLLHIVGGLDTGPAQTNAHTTFNSGDTRATATNYPESKASSGCSSVRSSNAFNRSNGGTTSYVWNGSWSSSITVTYTVDANYEDPPHTGYSSNVGLACLNGGANTSILNTTAHFDGTSYAAGTSSTNSRCAGAGSVI
jgi:hypothetical protein